MSKIGVPLEGFADFSRKVAADGIVLLKNENNFFPINKERVSVFGRCQIDTYRSGTGSGGAVNIAYHVDLIDGLRANENIELNENLADVYSNWVKNNPFDNGNGGWASEPWFQEEMPVTNELVENAAKYSNKAIMVIGRTAGEDKDNADVEGGYRLTKTEIDVLEKLTDNFKQVAVLLNVANVIDMNFINSPKFNNQITAVMYVWQGGIEGGNAMADVISGDITPSGKLADTIAYKIDDYPTTKNFGGKDKAVYQEDIYLGYRYFETFAPQKVMYPFGYGLSYTTFDIKQEAVKMSRAVMPKAVINFAFKVTNTGDTFGKETVQLYVEAPQGKLGKPAKQLIGFAKTDKLLSNESEIVNITVPVSQLASYDDSGSTGNKSCFVLESGEYKFWVGTNVRDVKQVSVNGQPVLKIDELVVIKKVEEACAPTENFTRMKPGKQLIDGTYELTYENVPTRTVDMEKRIISRLPKTLEITGDKNIKLQDVKNNKATMEQFIAQFNIKELAAIVRGEGMCSIKVTPGTASAFGGLSKELLNYGIPAIATADGPSGIRMENGAKATQVPIGTTLACTWNVKYINQLYNYCGQELLRNEIDVLLGPGMNIHRHPLNGRNFEYYSEDPFLTGKIAAAVTLGLKDGGAFGTLKHFAANDQETDRNNADSIMSERAAREVHLRPFEIAVKEGQAKSIMTAYNPINGYWAASNYDMNTTILRNEWKFDGMVMTDWWAKMNDPIKGGKSDKSFASFMIRAQNDIYKVVTNDGALSNLDNDNIETALTDGSLTLGELQRCAMNICNFAINTKAIERFTGKQRIAKVEPLTQNIENDKVLVKTDNEIEFKTKQDKTIYFEVETAGVYDVLATMAYKHTSLAQSACNIELNGTYVGSAQLHGTGGADVTKRLFNVELDKGIYEFKCHYIRTGIEFKSIQIKMGK